MTDACPHISTAEGALAGGQATEVCRDCGAFRVAGGPWRPADEYEAATAS